MGSAHYALPASCMTCPSPGCECKTPRPRTDPRFTNTCVVCGRLVHPEWSSANIAPLLNRLRDIPEVEVRPRGSKPKTDPNFQRLLDQCLARELAGRDYYALRFHGIDNEAEAMEEAADWANYLMFGILKRRRQGRETHDDLALRAVFHIWQAYVATCEIQRKDAGAP